MANNELNKYIRAAVATTPPKHPEAAKPRMMLKSDNDFGGLNFSMMWAPVSVPFEMVSEHHQHDFDQYLVFNGGDPNNMVDLGGEVELTLSEDGVHKQKFVFTEATEVFIKRGLFHGPLVFTKVNDPGKPIIFHDMYFAPEYQRITG